MRKTAILIIYIILFWVVLPGVLVLSAIYFDKLLGFESNPALVAGILIMSIALPMLVISIAQFRIFSGKYPVSADPPKVFIRTGLYAVWRHPIYLFYGLTLLGSAMIWGSRGMLLITLPAFIVLEFVYGFIEEKILVKRFGDKYLNYKKITSIVIPRLYYWLKIPCFFLFAPLFSYKVSGKENIPDSPPFFLVSCHRNYIDPFFLAQGFPYPIRNITTFEMYRTGKTRWFFKALDCIPKKRYLNDYSTGREIVKAIRQDAVIGIYPEGERAWTETMNRLKPETLNLFHKFRDIPILPVKLQGSFFAWPMWGKGVRNARVRVEFQEIIQIDPDWDLKEIEDRLVAAIEPGDQDHPDFFCRSTRRIEDISKVIYRCPICMTFDSIKTAATGGVCLNCKAVLRIDERYRLNVSNGENQVSGSLDEVYKRIRVRSEDLSGLASGSFPGQFESHSKGEEHIIAFSEQAEVSMESFPKMKFLFKGDIILTNKRLVFESDSDSRSLTLEDLSSVTTESNIKLQIYDFRATKLYQVVFDRESVVKWQDLISETIKMELGRVPNLR
ncbi:MAG TPA: hypothetical protein ENI20_03595 [Bacteroides sp.]|nr:hypothetical protein [Bacteroides sp.]